MCLVSHLRSCSWLASAQAHFLRCASCLTSLQTHSLRPRIALAPYSHIPLLSLSQESKNQASWISSMALAVGKDAAVEAFINELRGWRPTEAEGVLAQARIDRLDQVTAALALSIWSLSKITRQLRHSTLVVNSMDGVLERCGHSAGEWDACQPRAFWKVTSTSIIVTRSIARPFRMYIKVA